MSKWDVNIIRLNHKRPLNNSPSENAISNKRIPDV